MKDKFFWLEILIYNIGFALFCLFKFDFKGIVEVYYWSRIHIEYKGKFISYGKLSFQRIICDLVGLITLLLPIYLLTF